MSEVTAERMTPEQQVDYWMDRYFALHDEYAALLNQINAIETILAGDTDG